MGNPVPFTDEEVVALQNETVFLSPTAPLRRALATITDLDDALARRSGELLALTQMLRELVAGATTGESAQAALDHLDALDRKIAGASATPGHDHWVTRYCTDQDLRRYAVLAEKLRCDRRTWGVIQSDRYPRSFRNFLLFAVRHVPRLVEVALANAAPPVEAEPAAIEPLP